MEDAVAIGDGVVEGADAGSGSDVLASGAGAVGSALASVAVVSTSTVSTSAGVSVTVDAVGAVAEALGACSIGIALQSTVKMSPGFNSVFGLRTYPRQLNLSISV